jgi:hypothetical protein
LIRFSFLSFPSISAVLETVAVLVSIFASLVAAFLTADADAFDATFWLDTLLVVLTTCSVSGGTAVLSGCLSFPSSATVSLLILAFLFLWSDSVEF